MKPFLPVALISAVMFTFFFNQLQAQFSVSGEFRPRFEYRDGYLKLRDSGKIGYPTIPGRNRLIFDYANDKFTARFSIQHAYIFGENNYSSDTISRNTLNIYEAWFRYSINKSLAFKVGRTELIYDDGRVLGNANWNPKGASHDVAIFQADLTDIRLKTDLGFAINNPAVSTPYLEPYPMKNYKYMGYLYLQRKMLNDKLIVSVLGITDIFQKAPSQIKTTTVSYDTGYVISINKDTIGTFQTPVYTVNNVLTNYPDFYYGRGTAGATAGFTKDKLKIFLSGYYQFGKLKDSRDVNAFMLGCYVSYQVIKPLNLLLGYDYMSGNDYSKTTDLKTKSTAFSTLYSNSHGFYGYMDLFSSQLSAGDGPGLTDMYAKATLKATEKATIEATYRYFSIPHGYLPSNAANPSSTSYLEVNKALGSELDLMFVYKLEKNFEINAAYCFFLPEKSMEISNGLKPGTSAWAQYAYIMLTWKPNFFTSEKK